MLFLDHCVFLSNYTRPLDARYRSLGLLFPPAMFIFPFRHTHTHTYLGPALANWR